MDSHEIQRILIVVKDAGKTDKHDHDLFGLDMLLDNDGNVGPTHGLVLQGKGFRAKDFIWKNNSCELYFENADIDSFIERLKTLYPDTEFLHGPMTHSWNQVGPLPRPGRQSDRDWNPDWRGWRWA